MDSRIKYRKLYGETCIVVNAPKEASSDFGFLAKNYSGYILYNCSWLGIHHYVNGLLENPNRWSIISKSYVRWQFTYARYYTYYEENNQGLILDEVDGFSIGRGGPVSNIGLSEDHKSWIDVEKTDVDFEYKLKYFDIEKQKLYKVLTKDEIILVPKLPGIEKVIEGKEDFLSVVKAVE